MQERNVQTHIRNVRTEKTVAASAEVQNDILNVKVIATVELTDAAAMGDAMYILCRRSMRRRKF